MISFKKASNQWMRLNQIVWSFKWIIASLIVLNFVLLGACIYALNKDTVVVALTESESLYFIGERKKQEITEDDVIKTSKKFLKERYEWKSFSVDKVVRNLTPYTTYGFLKKLISQLEKSKAFIEKNKVSQDVIIQGVEIKDGIVTAHLDRVVAIGDKVKAVRPLKVNLEIVKENSNKWNLKGLYVNSIKEFER